MKRTINIRMDAQNFIICNEDIPITKISKTSLSINGKDIFDKLIKDMDRKTKFEFDVVVDNTIKDTNDLRICKDIERIFDNIANEINIKLKLQTGDVDALLSDISDKPPF